MKGLYIHIPFCRQKCFYCDFFSLKYIERLAGQYIKALSIHAGGYKNTAVDTVYVGGGTPSVLSESQIKLLMKTVVDRFDLKSVREFTFEMNPESCCEKKLGILKDSGVNRLSLGLQSSDDKILKVLGRAHDFAAFKKAYKQVGRAGFDNFNLDLIYGLPGQSAQDWEKELETAVGFGCGHISLYPLSIENKSVFFQKGVQTDDNLQRRMYEKAEDFLAGKGYCHYEISNWSKPGKQSLHNGNYWRNFEYIALGAGASGYENRYRYSNIGNIEKYIELVSKSMSAKSENIFIGDKEYEAEKIMLGLRLLDEGVDIKDFSGQDSLAVLGKFLKENLLVNDGGKIKLSKNAVFTSNIIMSAFMK